MMIFKHLLKDLNKSFENYYDEYNKLLDVEKNKYDQNSSLKT